MIRTGVSVASFACMSFSSTLAIACGGFFCSQEQPVDQTAERILFIQRDAETIETHVQIEYEGPASSFSWVVPTPSLPEIRTGLDAVFNALDPSALRPVPDVTQSDDPFCPQPDFSNAGGEEDAWSEADSGTSDPEVVVVGSATVGAFDTVTLQATDTQSMVDWLRDNAYDVPEGSEELLRPYVEMEGTYFVAFRLTKGASVGEMTPIVLEYEARAPMIPIQLTAVAAQPDMQIRSWILADYPALPSNYRLAELNPLRSELLGRLNGSWVNEFRLEAEAIDEADPENGHAFVRPAVGSGSDLGISQRLRERAQQGTELGSGSDTRVFAINFANRGFIEEGIAQDMFIDCVPGAQALLDEYEGDLESAILSLAAMDSQGGGPLLEGCSGRVDELFVTPLYDLADEFDRLAYVSLLKTYLDPEEMTVDPVFCYDQELGLPAERPSYHVTTLCDPALELPDGALRVEGDGLNFIVESRQMLNEHLGSLPALLRAHEGGCRDAAVAVDNEEAIASYLDGVALAYSESDSDGADAGLSDAGGANGDGTSGRPSNERGCAAGGGKPVSAALLALCVGLLIRRRRD